MIGAWLLIHAVVVTALPPCPAPAPKLSWEPLSAQAAAEAYVDVGEEELTNGSPQSAVTAFGEALMQDPHNAKARARWNELCAQGTQAPAPDTQQAKLAEAVALYESGKLRAAGELFARLRKEATTPDPAAALLEGICWYELGEDGRARPLLLLAQKDPPSRDSASVFLGLISLRNRQEDVAASYFQAVSSDDQSPLHKDALSLLRLARQSGRVVFTLLASGGYDSNSDLLPDGAPSMAGTVPGPALDFVGSFLVRPQGENGPFARALGTFRKDLIPNTEQQGSFSGGVGWQLGRNARHLSLEYSLDFIEVGGETFALAHRGQSAFRWTLGRLGFGVLLNARWLDYRYPGMRPFTGTRLEPIVETRYRAGSHLFRLSGRYTRASTRAGATSFDALGFEAAALLEFAPVRVLVEPFWETRDYDAFDTPLGVRREDHSLGGVVGLDWDLGLHWTWQWTLTGRHTLSNAAISPTRVTLWTGISYTLGVL